MPAVIGIIAALIGAIAGFAARHLMGRQYAHAAERQAEKSVRDAQREAETVLKEARLQAKSEAIKSMEQFESATKTRRQELAAVEERIVQREDNLDRKVAVIEKKELSLDTRIGELERLQDELRRGKQEVDKLIVEEKERIQRVAGMTQDEARRTLLERIEKEVNAEAGMMIRRIQEEAKDTAERDAWKITAQAVQRFAVSHAGEMMTSTVALPGDEMKGRIIGRDGRNIRALEAATGVNVLIDDTPEAVVISGFDPVRREVAKRALETLINDGRIHPARIEEVVAKVQENMDEMIRLAGEEASFSMGVQGLDPELVRTLGRLKFRTSYSQNVLQHSLEVAGLMGVMAGEMGLDSSLAKRIGLFHDIGKALDHSVEGGHALIGADLLKRHSEAAITVNAVAAHHEEVPAESLYAILASAADAISSSRLGARSETTSIYIKRLEKLEAICNGFEGVAKSYAIQAGREVRVIVEPERVDDNASMSMARNISKKIESELQYPGQIRVTVIRETRCVEYAR